MRRLLLAASVFLAACATSITAEPAATVTPAPPAWFVENIEYMTKDGGLWIASNAAYKSESEAWDSYAVEWTAGPANHSMAGRLFAIKDGKETELDFWQFSQYWNPLTNEAVLQQTGWGSSGIGVMNAYSDGGPGEIETVQTFISPDRTTRLEGHRTSESTGNSHRTISFKISAETWEQQRSYVWKRTPR